ncbi:globin domain-containing protein [Streptomyces boninensis]|uniref:globin domain-containing protein n=1 Tax=Streptomyces boninensis TaxID=2039455 RepID=UPI003B22218E
MAKYFYAHLFTANPGVRPLFPEDMTEQRDRLFAALTAVVQRLDDPELPVYLKALGRDHRKFAAEPAHYAAVGESLIAALKFATPTTWDAETEAAWLGAYKVLSDAMISGAEEADRDHAPRWWECRVVEHRRPARGVAVLTLAPDGHFPFRAGQFVSVAAEQLPQVWRPYSLAAAPRPDNTLELHVSRVDGGLLSPALTDEVRMGDILRLGPATGMMTLPEEPSPTAPATPTTLVAAGTGWAPVRALLEELTRRPPVETRVFLVARASGELYDEAAIRQLGEAHPWLNVQLLTRAERLPAALSAYAGWEQHDAYVSGPPGFISYATDLLAGSGVPPGRIRHDPVPQPQRTPRNVGHAQWFLDRRQPQWINPADR